MNRNVLRNLAMALLVGVTLTGCVKEYTITVVSNNDAWGTVTGTGTYAFGEEVTITATPVTGYYFQRWDDGVNTNPRIVTVEGTKVYTAVFASNSGDNPPPGGNPPGGTDPTTVSGTISNCTFSKSQYYGVGIDRVSDMANITHSNNTFSQNLEGNVYIQYGGEYNGTTYTDGQVLNELP